MTIRRVILSLAVVAALACAVLFGLGRGLGGRFDSAVNEPVPVPRPAAAVAAGAAAQTEAASAIGGASAAKQVLFGDLHAHTTISFDAFMLNLPLLGGSGAAPPADACDFARHCAALDFWSINDHAANITEADWRSSIEAIRQCNDVAGDPADPDLVSYLGWEWTQAGLTPETHYGHKNVVLRHTDDARIPSRPVAASRGGTATNPPPTLVRGALAATDARFRDLAARWTALGEMDVCADAPVRELPGDCREIAETPAALFAKLDDWGHEAVVIPHGTTWGIYTPPGSTWAKQLEGDDHDPARQTLLEVYSGHGDGEVHRPWRAVETGADGALVCPEPTPDYLPVCWHMGRIVETRCLEAGEPADECAARAAEARAHAAAAGVSPHVTVPGVSAKALLDAGQCRDCGQPAFAYRPGGSAQYILALSREPEAEGAPRRFRFGFMAASDIHSARPGTGYKETRELSESPPRVRPEGGGAVASFLTAEPEPPAAHSRSIEAARELLTGLQLYESERTRSFLYTGGLMAVHAEARDRDAIWRAIERREVYGTSGPRILLWFDLVDGDAAWPMGSAVERDEAPTFRVRAVGSLEQAEGCPEATLDALGAERTASLCAGECYSPTDRRRRLTRIDVVRIRPQLHADESITELVDDPWRSFACPPDPAGCEAVFVDDEYPGLGRDAVYYARVFEEETPAVNGRPLRCTWDEAGACVETEPCADTGECIDLYAQRAWSSPIFVDRARD